MTDDPNRGTAAGAGGAAPAGASGTPGQAGTEAGQGGKQETVEELRKKLADEQAARAAREKERDDERALRLAQQEKVEAANRVLRAEAARASATPPQSGADNLAQAIAAEEAHIANLENSVRAYEGEPAAQALAQEAVKSARSRLGDMYRARDQRQLEARQREWLEGQAEAPLPAGLERFRDKAKELLKTGLYNTLEAAAMAARGQALPEDLEDPSDVTRLREENARLKAQQERGVVGAGTPRPALSFERGKPGSRLRITHAEEERIGGLSMSDPDRIAYSQALKAGQLEYIDRP